MEIWGLFIIRFFNFAILLMFIFSAFLAGISDFIMRKWPVKIHLAHLFVLESFHIISVDSIIHKLKSKKQESRNAHSMVPSTYAQLPLKNQHYAGDREYPSQNVENINFRH